MVSSLAACGGVPTKSFLERVRVQTNPYAISWGALAAGHVPVPECHLRALPLLAQLLFVQLAVVVTRQLGRESHAARTLEVREPGTAILDELLRFFSGAHAIA